MLQRGILIEDIRKGLAVFPNYMRPGGKLNLTDTNVHAEDFVAGLLNAIYGWNLVSTSKITANFPCVDLIDEGLGVGVQVTSEKGSGKLTDTVECLERHGLAGKIRQLKVFSLIAKQERYTVNAECRGIAFDWRKDVLDFDDAIQAANGISDLQHLRRVHQHVVDGIPWAFPEYGTHLPPLNVPATDPTKNWLAFSSRATSLIGRDAERSRLSEFLDSPPKFSWWLMTGTAGSGKSRLALELCRQAASEWHAGFLSRTEKDFKWSQFKTSRRTLIVIDYVASRAAEVSEAVLTLSRTSSSFSQPVRVLLVERDKGSWWTTFSREESHSESAEIAACQHGDPLGLPGLPPKAILQLAEEVVRARNGTWNAELAQEFLPRLYNLDPRARPLFAMIVARYLEAAESDAAGSNLLQVVLKREAARRSQLIRDTDKLQRMENLLLLATLVSGLLPKANGFDYLAASDVAGLLPDVGLVDETLYNDMAGSAGGSASFAGLQPDILGERFVLDRLSEIGIGGLNSRRLLQAAWSFQPEDVGVFAVRSAFDFHGDPGLEKLFDLPLDASEARIHWAEMVGDLIAHTGRVEDYLSHRQLRKLISLADRNPQEQELQEAAARADYNMGKVCMFQDNGFAIERFDAAIARVGKGSLIGKIALHNRNLLLNDDNNIHDACTEVIESSEASDEMRACAFNNRADVHAEHGEHDNAIRDRTKLLALNDTSPDRRFIALFRRSRSYSAIGNDQAALHDLGRILETWDITPHQKSDARLERAVIMRRLERWHEARADLEAVIGSNFLFSGTRAMALVELADVSRRTGEHAQADGFLSKAAVDPEAREETLVDAMIVGALLREDTGNMDGASEMWRNVLAAPSASDDQVRAARRRLDAISPRKRADGDGASPS